MNDDHPRSTLARAALVLVSPAAIVETAIARKQFRIPIRIVIEHHEHLPFEVGALEIIPLKLGGLDAITDEHDFRVFYGGGFALHAARSDKFIAIFEIDFLAVDIEAPGFGQLRSHPDDVHRLFPLSIWPTRPQSQTLQLSGKV